MTRHCARRVIVHLALGSALLSAGCSFSFGNAESPGKAEGSPKGEKSGDKEGGGPNDVGDPPGGPVAEAQSGSGRQGTPPAAMSGKARGHFDAGQKSYARGDLKGALSQYNQAIEADANAAEAHYARGLVLERQDKKGDAANAYRKALEIVPDYEAAIRGYALLLARQGNEEQAMSFLAEKNAKYPERASILTSMAEVRSIQGQSGEAQRLAQEALKHDPSYKPAMLALARDHYRARRIDLALYALKGILDGYGEGNPPRDPKNPEALLLRGIIYSERDMRGPAMEDLAAAVELRADLVQAHMLLATYMIEAGNAQGAIPHLESAVRYDNDNVVAHLQLGDAYRLLDRAAEAKQQLEWVLQADPDQVGAHYNLGLLYLLSDKLPDVSELAAAEKAIEHFEAYKAKAPRGGPDDVDELITRAKTKKALLEAQQAEGAEGADGAEGAEGANG